MAYQLQDWLKAKQIKTLYISPGSPWEQAWIESFHDKLRDELLNREWFTGLVQTQCLLNQGSGHRDPQTPTATPWNLRESTSIPWRYRPWSQLETPAP
jgi:transposase InsO family protein